MTLSPMLAPVSVPSMAKNIARKAPESKVRTRHAKDPFISTHDIVSAVSVIHMLSDIRPVDSPQIMGSVPDKPIRTPQLMSGSKLSFCISALSRLYEER